MSTVVEVLTPGFILRDALVASVLVGIVCPLVGVYFVLRRMIFLGVALPQVSAAGIAFALLVHRAVIGPHPHGETTDAILARLGATTFTLGGILLLALLERRGREFVEARIGMAYAILFGFSDYWAFQYFAWGLPFWFFLRWWFAIPAVSLTSLYLYLLHSLFCGNPWLLGTWDFAAHPTLPFVVLLVRDLAVSFFLLSACVFLVGAIRRQPALPIPISS